MTDLTKTIAAKSDQLNADDLIGRTLTIKITNVTLLAGDQPVAIAYEGDNGKPWKPCKSMRRVLVGVWGGDGNKYAGRSLTLYRDPNVSFGGQQVGGIRISHMSHIEQAITLSLTAARNSKKPFTVQPLRSASPPPVNGADREQVDEEALLIEATEKAKSGMVALEGYWKTLSKPKQLILQPRMTMLKNTAAAVDADPFGLPPVSNQPATSEDNHVQGN